MNEQPTSIELGPLLWLIPGALAVAHGGPTQAGVVELVMWLGAASGVVIVGLLAWTLRPTGDVARWVRSFVGNGVVMRPADVRSVDGSLERLVAAMDRD